MLGVPTLLALHSEIDLKYPNRVLMDHGLVICRYGDCLKITNGSCVPGDGGSHHECLFRLCIFRPFVEEVCVGKIVKSTPEGVQVSLGFFQDIFIPAYWMLRPSHYDEKVGLWVWTPNYEEEEKDQGEEETAEGRTKDDDADDVNAKDADETGIQKSFCEPKVSVKLEDPGIGESTSKPAVNGGGKGDGGEEGDRFEMEIGAAIRFKVKSIQFTQVTNTAKGVQATTTTTAHSHSFPKDQEEQTPDKPQTLRKRSTSVDLSDVVNLPSSMHVVASICEDGLGLTSWWTAVDEEDEEAPGAEAEEDDDEEHGVVDGDGDDDDYEQEYE